MKLKSFTASPLETQRVEHNFFKSKSYVNVYYSDSAKQK